MTIPRIETFEGDITQEIKQQQASVTDNLAAQKSPEVLQQPNTLPFAATFIFIGLFILVIALLGYYFYIHFTASTKTPEPSFSQTVLETVTPKQNKEEISLSKILPESQTYLERFVTTIEKKDAGYVITINNYSEVYGYILANESTFGKELLSLFTTIGEENAFISFSDITESNQDMRTYQNASSTGITYGFLGTSTLLIADSPSNLIGLRNAILK